MLAGRRINDGMGEWVVQQLVLELARRRVVIGGARVLVLGLSFKENCPDLRNTRVIDVITALRSYGMEPLIVDPWVDPLEAKAEYGLQVSAEVPVDDRGECFAAVIAAVSHREFVDLDLSGWQSLLHPDTVVFDLKGMVPARLRR